MYVTDGQLRTVSLYTIPVVLTFTICISGSFRPLKIQSPDEFFEGQASVVTCTAYYTCPQHLPELSWSYSNVPASTAITKTGKAQWTAVSKLMFTASANDNDRSLTCSVKFSGDHRQSKSITLRVKSK